MNIFRKLLLTTKRWYAKAQQMSFRNRIGLLAGVILIFIILISGTPDQTAVNEMKDERAVDLINVGVASLDTTPLVLTGTVRGSSEANLRAQRSGEVVGVYRLAGEKVSPGTLIAELENRSERANVAQAQAQLEIAKANLQKGRTGARSEDRLVLEANLLNAENQLSTAKTTAVNTLTNTYQSLDEIILTRVDTLFSNPTSVNPTFNVASSNSATVSKIRQDRVSVGNILARQNSAVTTTGDAVNSLTLEIDETEEELRLVIEFLDRITFVLSQAVPSPSVREADIASFRTLISTARKEVNGLLTQLSTARSSLTGAQTSLTIAEQNLEKGTSGAQSEDIEVLEAGVRQAEAGLAVANANLSKTLIISPIFGTLTTQRIRVGDFVNAFDSVAIVSNENSLEIVTFITENEKNDISVGNEVLIAGRYNGVITNIAPGLDPQTRKIEVRIALTSEEASLVNGSSVRVSIKRDVGALEIENLTRILIPLSTLKVETSRTIVYTVDNDNRLVPNEVELGLVLGDSVVIESGLTFDMNIVRDARGLRDGQLVTVN